MANSLISMWQTVCRCVEKLRSYRLQATPFDTFEAMSCWIFSLALCYFIISQHYVEVVTPRSLPYMYLTIVILTFIGVCAWFGLFHDHNSTLKRCFIALLIPTAMVLFPLSALSDSITGSSAREAIAITTVPATDSQARRIQNGNLQGFDRHARRIVVQPHQFGLWYDEIEKHLQEYDGYTITVTGFVSRPSHSTHPDQFILSRNIMTCCILDMSPFGFTAEYSAAHTLNNNTWITITATIHTSAVNTTSQSYEGLVLQVSSIQHAKPDYNYFYRIA